jgi:hypothetical protein
MSVGILCKHLFDQEILCLLVNGSGNNVITIITTSLYFEPFDPINILALYIFTIHFNIILPFLLTFPK